MLKVRKSQNLFKSPKTSKPSYQTPSSLRGWRGTHGFSTRRKDTKSSSPSSRREGQLVEFLFTKAKHIKQKYKIMCFSYGDLSQLIPQGAKVASAKVGK